MPRLPTWLRRRFDALCARAEAMVDPYQGYDRAEGPPERLWPFFRVHLEPFRRVLWLALGFGLAVALVETWLIYYAGRVVDVLAETAPADLLAERGLELAAVALGVLLLRPLVQGIDALLLNQAMLPNVGALVRWRTHRHVLRQSMTFFQNDFAGRVAQKVMQTAPAVGEAVFQIFDALWYAIIYLIGALVLLTLVDPRLAIPLAVWAAGYVWMLVFFVPRIGQAAKDFSEARSTMTGRIVDSYTNIQTVKLFAHAAREDSYAHEAIEHGRTTFARQMRLITAMELALSVTNGLLMVSVIGLAIWLWSLGQASLGAIAAASALVLRLNAMTGWIMWATSDFFQNLGVVMEGVETISKPLGLTDRPNARPLAVTGGDIRFEGVSHHYGRGAGGLDRVELRIRAGERVGLIGRSGAGKSTLVNLLLRFYDVEGGRVLIDGQDIREATQDSLRAAIGMVTQDTSLLHRSVRDNILYGRPDARMADVEAAAKRVSAHEFILGLRDPAGREGYDAHVGERGVKLSGGQRQRIALARVVLKDAPILVLDEATSALDSEVEAEIQQALYGLMEGKTVIAIAHRLSTIARMDRIVTLDAGRVVESGPHAELLAAGGLYAGFWARQAGGFIDADAA
ncbi:MAG: ABC transporter ATP-binding protein [Rubrimonas sp.]|uniref:ABC transporter ATP-binding protein n=1 Tax=Rubrimonas sp. TaxID=2036015 RepID=UPI002FDD341E